MPDRPRPPGGPFPVRLSLVCLALAGVILVADVSLPLGVAGGVPYVAVVLVSLGLRNRSFTLGTAALCSVLTVVGFFGSPPPQSVLWIVLTNRGLALFAIWVTALLGLNLARASERLRTILDTVGDGIVTIDASGTIQSFNPAAERLFGYDARAIVGTSVNQLMPAPYADEHDGHLAAYRRTGVSTVIGTTRELVALHRDGTVFPIELDVSESTMDGRPIYTGAVRDITDRKAAEAELARYRADLERMVAARTHELTTVNTELESFAYAIAHDLRAPLRALAGYSAVLLEDYPDQLDDDGKHAITRIGAATMRMDQLITALLELSRLTRGPVRRRRLDLSGLAEAVCAELGQEAAGRPPQFDIQPGLYANADPSLMRAALSNLLTNAMKFTAACATARIGFGCVESPNGEAMPTYYVRDNGVGFDPEYADKLFQPFQRLHKLEEYPGTGIGLATVQRIIRRHGGNVWAESAVGEGATFFFTLPGDDETPA